MSSISTRQTVKALRHEPRWTPCLCLVEIGPGVHRVIMASVFYMSVTVMWMSPSLFTLLPLLERKKTGDQVSGNGEKLTGAMFLSFLFPVEWHL